MRHQTRLRGLLTGLALLPLLAPDAFAQKGKEPEHFTPRAAPTVILPKLTPAGVTGKDAPQASAPLLPPPLVPAPLSPVLVPGAAPVAPKPVPVAVAAPPALPAPAPAPAAVIPPPKPERVAEPTPAVAKPAPEPEKPQTERSQAEKQLAEKPKPGRRTVWVKDDVYVRSAPNRSARALDALGYGEKLEVAGDAPDGWVRVARGGEVLGYVSGKLLMDKAPAKGSYAKASKEDRGCALPGDVPENRRPAIAVGSAARVLADANLRVAPACDAKVRDVLEDGESVTVMGVSGGWYKVGRQGRMLGYVGAALLGTAKR